MGKTWHPHHFTCLHCKNPISDKNFFERSGSFYCEKDFSNLFSPKCAACDGPILDVSFEYLMYFITLLKFPIILM